MSTASPLTPRRALAARLLLAAFAVVVALDLGGLLAGYPELHLAVKPLLLSVLAAWVAVRGGPPALIAAALFGWGGDTLLRFQDDTAFLLGMGSFAVGHLCYLRLFARYGTVPRRALPLGAAYAAALVLLVALLWPDLPAGLRLPVAGYSLLLTTMAFGALRLGAATAAGGLLFLLSDALIAMNIAEWHTPAPHDFWVMSTYLAAQYLLVTGVLRAAGAPGAAAAPDEPRPAVGA
ncbi:lysoplasmalogenase [Streptomyces diastaticus]|uniref:lysoplasmalogenase n=1 Tax=Streptomyces TaxID=1883 RepID=UPI0013C010C7|nr:lysoplasmalogenase [Streptomyces sp. DSM 41037]MDQ0296213.1 putative membrane protein YhhN [Streptomyces sp. DSM 41037]NEE37942.1 lysoplasmalogenase [Streptomyces sp. SID7982]WSU38450.1 lysoplasmalogenase [Streptomyces gougerotii]